MPRIIKAAGAFGLFRSAPRAKPAGSSNPWNLKPRVSVSPLYHRIIPGTNNTRGPGTIDKKAYLREAQRHALKQRQKEKQRRILQRQMDLEARYDAVIAKLLRK